MGINACIVRNDIMNMDLLADCSWNSVQQTVRNEIKMQSQKMKLQKVKNEFTKNEFTKNEITESEK